MTAQIINLKRARKAKARAAKAEEAGRNRAAFGRPKSERAASDAERARGQSLLDGARRVPAAGEGGGGGDGGGVAGADDLDPGSVS